MSKVLLFTKYKQDLFGIVACPLLARKLECNAKPVRRRSMGHSVVSHYGILSHLSCKACCEFCAYWSYGSFQICF